MSEQSLGSLPPDHAGADAVSLEPRGDSQALTRFEQDQLAREFADIERATAALRLGEPALQSWTKPAAPAAAKPRSLWLLIGILWLSTAIVTAGAVAAIATLAG